MFRKAALIFAKWEAITICVFMSSGGRSITVFQNGARSWSECLRQVSAIDHIPLHRTSVATCGYLSWVRQIPEHTYMSTLLESAAVLSFDLTGDITEQTLEDIDPLQVIDKPGILGLALLKQLVFI